MTKNVLFIFGMKNVFVKLIFWSQDITNDSRRTMLTLFLLHKSPKETETESGIEKEREWQTESERDTYNHKSGVGMFLCCCCCC